MALGFIWPLIMTVGVFFVRESPRWDYRHGKTEEARITVAQSYGVGIHHEVVELEMGEIKEKLEAETQGTRRERIMGTFTGPRMLYRVLLGVGLQTLQQLTGANFFFYYGTSIFQSTGINNSYVTSMILSGVNFGTTFFGLYVVEHFGRRRSLIVGALWMFVCFMIFASIGHYSLDRDNPQNSPHSGKAMIVFACFFIAAFAMTWGPIVWTIIGELYPTRYRAICMGIATAANWVWNFLISFFTPYITGAIDYRYGYIFASCCFLGAVVVYVFLCESQGRTLEEIDTMYLLHISPLKSSKWNPEESGGVIDQDHMYSKRRSNENPLMTENMDSDNTESMNMQGANLQNTAVENRTVENESTNANTNGHNEIVGKEVE